MADNPPTNAYDRQVASSLHSAQDGQLDSPVFDLRGQQAPATNSLRTVEVGHETIPIAPHPTTNRYPWAPVDNPTVPVYQTVQPPAQPLPAPLPAAPPISVAPAGFSAPPAIELPAPPARPRPAAPVVPEPAQEPQIQLPEPPPPVAEPPVTQAPVADTIPDPVPVVATSPAVNAAPMTPFPENHARRPMRIYSEYSREVWRTLRPGRLLFVVLIIVGTAVIAALIVLTVISGSPSKIFELPLLRQLISR